MWAELLLVLVVIVLFLIYKVQIPKTKAALLEGARKSTKMTEFDFESNPRFLEGLEVSIAEMPRANLKVLGRVWVNFLLHRRLVERLKFINYLKLNPQIEKVPVEKPIFIVGLPRTGSTLLFNLLALDSGVQTMKLWELVYPIPNPFDPLTNEQRIRLIGAALKFQKTFSPQLNKIHFMDPLIPEEETLWFSQNNWFPGLAVGTATEGMSQWFLNQEDQTGDKALPMYQDFKRILQMRQVQSEKPPRWLFKGVLIHMHVLPALLRVFPDAQIVYLRRDPCEVVASSASLETEMGRHFQHLNEEQHAKQRMPLLVALEKSLKNFRASLSKEQEKKQFLNLGYKQIVSDPIGTVKTLYEHFGLDFSDAYHERLNRYMKENPQHKHGKHSYNLKKYGLTEEQVREAFAPVYGTE